MTFPTSVDRYRAWQNPLLSYVQRRWSLLINFLGVHSSYISPLRSKLNDNDKWLVSCGKGVTPHDNSHKYWYTRLLVIDPPCGFSVLRRYEADNNAINHSGAFSLQLFSCLCLCRSENQALILPSRTALAKCEVGHAPLKHFGGFLCNGGKPE